FPCCRRCANRASCARLCGTTESEVMKKLIVLIALAAAGYFAYAHFQGGNPEHVENPVYAELRVGTEVVDRELNLVLFGEMGDDVDCRERFGRAWNKIVEGCVDCSMRLSSCRS